MHNKRLFVGCEIDAPWPESWPPGKIIEKEARHLTLLFLGEQEMEDVNPVLPDIPMPTFPLAMMGVFSEVLFFPYNDPRVAAWKMSFSNHEKAFLSYHHKLKQFFSKKFDISHLNNREYLPHVTVGRTPKDKRKWKSQFIKRPWVMKKIHLYESLGFSKYRSLWSCPMLAPYERIDSSSELVFKIRGEDYNQIEQAAQMALAFEYPEIVPFIRPSNKRNSLDEVTSDLNRLLSMVEYKIGSPFKSVSSKEKEREIGTNLFEWEMVVKG